MTWLASDPPLPARYPGPARFTHADLLPERLLRDTATGRISGVIDWTDAPLGDPALDLVFLFTWRGPAFADAVLAEYGGPADLGLRTRAFFLARVLSLTWLVEAAERREELDPARERVWNVFRRPAGPAS